MLRYWYYAVPPVYLAVLLAVQPADRIVMIAADHPPPGYPFTRSFTRCLTDDCDTLAYVIRAENAARGRKAGVVGPGWFDKDTGFRAYDPFDPDRHVKRDGVPFEPVSVDTEADFERLLKFQQQAAERGEPEPLRDRYFLEYPPLALYLFRLGLIGAPGDGADVPPAILDEHQYFVGCHPPATAGEAAVYARFRHAIRIYAVLMTLAQLGLMLLLDRRFPGCPTWLLVLPGFLYFTPCRFDILPAALVVASVAAADRRRVAIAGLCLGLAVGLKMYPLVLAPILLRFTARSWKDAAVWCVAAGLPVLLSYGVMYVTDGVEGATIPLRFQLARDPEWDWCFYNKLLPPAWAFKTPQAAAVRVLVPLVASVLLSLRRPPDVFSLLRRCTIALVAFLSLSVFYSPQWWQWLAVLLVPLAGRHKWLVWPVVILDLWTYLHFPLLFDSILGGAFGDSVKWVRDLHVLVRAQLWFAVAAAFAWIEVRSGAEVEKTACG